MVALCLQTVSVHVLLQVCFSGTDRKTVAGLHSVWSCDVCSNVMPVYELHRFSYGILTGAINSAGLLNHRLRSVSMTCSLHRSGHSALRQPWAEWMLMVAGDRICGVVLKRLWNFENCDEGISIEGAFFSQWRMEVYNSPSLWLLFGF